MKSTKGKSKIKKPDVDILRIQAPEVGSNMEVYCG